MREGIRPPPAPEPPGAPPAQPRRRFQLDGEEWTAAVAGRSAYGVAMGSPASLELIRFHRGADPRPRREALLAAGRFRDLGEEELISLWRGATVLPGDLAAEGGEPPAPTG